MIVVLFFLLVSGIYCTKKDVSQNEPKELTLKTQTGTLNFTAKAKSKKGSKHHLEKPLPILQEEQSSKLMSAQSSSVYCGGMATG